MDHFAGDHPGKLDPSNINPETFFPEKNLGARIQVLQLIPTIRYIIAIIPLLSPFQIKVCLNCFHPQSL